jgi:chloride channel protein, CIC family
MMRRDVPITSVDLLVSVFCQALPLGSAKQVAAIDAEGRCAGLVAVSEAHQTENQSMIEQLLHHVDDMLLPEMNIKQAVRTFDRTEAEALVVVDSRVERRVLGLLTEAHALRRYTDALELRRRDVFGEES